MSPMKICLLVLLVVATGSREGSSQQVNTTSLQPAIEEGLIKLCLGLQKAAAASAAKDENIIFAPLSIAAVHALLLAAAEGVTKTELEAMFGVDKVPHKQQDLHMLLSEFIFNVQTNQNFEKNLVSANGLFPQLSSQIFPQYIDFAKKVYQSEVIPIDYKSQSEKATDFINSWVYNRTEGKIKKILDQFVDSATSLIIANAFHFKGSWEEPFIANFTKMQDFKVNKQEVVKVPMMASILNVFYGHRRGKEAIVGLPYKDGDLVMYFVLPDSDLKEYVDSLTVDTIRELITKAKRHQTIVAIPRMKVEGNLELSKALYSLGLHSLFSRKTANLPYLGHGAYVSEVVHKVTVEVSEWGTEAAASTTTVVNRDGSTPLFRADKPFLFFLYQRKMNAILFWGTVYRPVE